MIAINKDNYSWHPSLEVLRECGFDPLAFDDLIDQCIDLGSSPSRVLVCKGSATTSEYLILSSPYDVDAFFVGYKYGELKANLVDSSDIAVNILSGVMKSWNKITASYKSDFLIEIKKWLKSLNKRNTDEKIGQLLGLSRSVVTNLLRLQKLDPVVKGLVSLNLISLANARTLASLDLATQRHLSKICTDRDLSYRELYAMAFPHLSKDKSIRGINKSPDIKMFERMASEKSGLDISYLPITEKNKEGLLEININTLGELGRVLDLVIRSSSSEDQKGVIKLKIERMDQINVLFESLLTEDYD